MATLTDRHSWSLTTDRPSAMTIRNGSKPNKCLVCGKYKVSNVREVVSPWVRVLEISERARSSVWSEVATATLLEDELAIRVRSILAHVLLEVLGRQ